MGKWMKLLQLRRLQCHHTRCSLGEKRPREGRGRGKGEFLRHDVCGSCSLCSLCRGRAFETSPLPDCLPKGTGIAAISKRAAGNPEHGESQAALVSDS